MSAGPRGVSERLDLDRVPERVAMVRLSAIGDTVHAMPIATSLKRAWPNCHVTWVIQPLPYELMRGRPDVDDFVIFHRQRGARAYRDFAREVAGRSFDLVLDMHPYFKAGVVTRLLRAPIRVGYDRARARDLSWLATNRRIPARPPGHVQDQYFEFLDFIGVPVVAEWDFHFTADELEARQAWLDRGDERPVLAVATRSSRREKDWTLDRYARVLDVAAADFGMRAVLIGGPSEGERADAARLADLCRHPPDVELHRDLRRMTWLLDASDALLSPDTGPLHIAVALGTPTIGLFGATDPKRVGPYRRFADLLIDRYTRPGETTPSRAVRRGNMESISEEDVIEKLDVLRDRYLRRGG